jgi:spore coat polysaccharide biosynthesis protein SpsF
MCLPSKFGVEVLLKKLAFVNKLVSVVILARFSSSRLPGKALMNIAGKTVLDHILDRLLRVLPLSSIILATSDLNSDDALERFANQRGIACHRGSLDKVGERFYAAARQIGLPYACRLNGDNIFLDPSLLLSLMKEAEKGKYSFLSNVQGRSFPKGMSIEIVDLNYYQKALPKIMSDSYCNEHVMVCLYKDPTPVDHFYFRNIDLPECAGIQLALDTPEDFERSQAMLAVIPEGRFDLNTTFRYYRDYEESIKG